MSAWPWLRAWISSFSDVYLVIQTFSPCRRNSPSRRARESGAVSTPGTAATVMVRLPDEPAPEEPPPSTPQPAIVIPADSTATGRRNLLLMLRLRGALVPPWTSRMGLLCGALGRTSCSGDISVARQVPYLWPG